MYVAKKPLIYYIIHCAFIQNVGYNKGDFFCQSFQHLILPDIATFYRHPSVNKAVTFSLFSIVKVVLKKRLSFSTTIMGIERFKDSLKNH